MNEDSRAIHCAFLCDNAQLAAQLTTQASDGWRQNINRKWCVDNENDFHSSSVRLTTPQMADSPSGHGMANETINI